MLAKADRAVLGESNERVSWNKMGERCREIMEGYKRKPRKDFVHGEVWEVRHKQKKG